MKSVTYYERAAREACLRAAERIAEKGWHQGSMFANADSPYEADALDAPTCAMGALHVCTPMNYDFTATISVAADLIKAEIGRSWATVPHWNDAPQRTAEDVILTLKRVGTGE